MTQTQNPGTGTPNQTETDKKEEGAHMTTKSMQMSRSSLTDSHAETKKIIDAEEEQKRERLEDDKNRLDIDCRVFADDIIPYLLDKAGLRGELAMIVETLTGAIRRILLHAADRTGWKSDAFINAFLELHIRFAEPNSINITLKQEEENVKN